MKNETGLKDIIETEKYTFEIYKGVYGWYANAMDKTGKGFFLYRWTTGKTKKDVLRTINAFVG